MNSIRSFSRNGKLVWAPSNCIVVGCVVFDAVEIDGVEYCKTYSNYVTDFNYTLPDSLNY